jgi:hypothetical protein
MSVISSFIPSFIFYSVLQLMSGIEAIADGSAYLLQVGKMLSLVGIVVVEVYARLTQASCMEGLPIAVLSLMKQVTDKGGCLHSNILRRMDG